MVCAAGTVYRQIRSATCNRTFGLLIKYRVNQAALRSNQRIGAVGSTGFQRGRLETIRSRNRSAGALKKAFFLAIQLTKEISLVPANGVESGKLTLEPGSQIDTISGGEGGIFVAIGWFFCSMISG